MKKLYMIQEGQGFYGGACGEDYAEVRIYKVRLWVLKEKRGGGFHGTPIENEEFIVIGNLKRAEREYEVLRNKYRTWIALKGYRGFVELYEVSINDDGTLSTYPDGEVYIDRESTEK